MSNKFFDFDRERLLAACSIKPEHFDEFQRLCITLVYGSEFQFVLVELYQQTYRDDLIKQLNGFLHQVQLNSVLVVLDENIRDITELESALLLNAAKFNVVHVIGGSGWLNQARWTELNLRRDTLAKQCQAKLIFWLTPEQIKNCANYALDLWAWRSGIYVFEENKLTSLHSMPLEYNYASEFSKLNQNDKAKRIAQIREWLKQDASPSGDIRKQLLSELASLLQELGLLNDSLQILHEELLVSEKTGDLYERAGILWKIANLYESRGEIDEAKRLYLEEILPVVEQSGDEHERASVIGRIASILSRKGLHAEALSLRLKKQLPVVEKTDDLRLRAIVFSEIADTFEVSGNLDEALRIREQKVLPVFEALGDVRLRAVTLSKMAGIMKIRGQLDEALRIHENEVIPVFERLGDIVFRTVALGKVSEIYIDKGQFEKALEIIKNEEIPAYEKLGDYRSRALAILNVARILTMQKKYDEALEIYQKDLYSFFITEGDTRDHIIFKADYALCLLEKNSKRSNLKIDQLLQEAFNSARIMKLPEINYVLDIIRSAKKTNLKRNKYVASYIKQMK